MKTTALDRWICETEGLTSLSREALENLQLKRFNSLLAHEKARGGFYSTLPESISSLDELPLLPFTTAEQLARHGASMLLCSQADIGRVISGSTSGTTGPSKRIFYSPLDIEHTVGFFAAGISEFTKPHDKVMIAMPFSGPFGLGDLISKAVERLDATPLHVGIGRSYGELNSILEEDAPSVYIGMAVPLLSFLRFAGRKSLRFALVSGDACPSGVLSCIEAILGSRLFPHYGSRECGLGGAVTCEAHEGMHIRENHIIAEIIDENGLRLDDGRWGELVLSTIGQQAQPLIRYRSGDIARILTQPCPCGGVTRRIEVLSRIDPFEASMSRLDDRLFRLPWLVDYSLRRTGGSMALDALSSREADPEELSAAVRELIPDSRLNIKIRPANSSDMPLYRGKRIVIDEYIAGK